MSAFILENPEMLVDQFQIKISACALALFKYNQLIENLKFELNKLIESVKKNDKSELEYNLVEILF